jgi:hypothetical protein
VRNIDSNVILEKTLNGVAFRSRISALPHIEIEGNILGIIPTRLINFMIPGNLNLITEEFVKIAVHGNEGKGIEINAAF